jgi:tRNA pseudouridine13 synthase
LRVRKRGHNTDQVARVLARTAGVTRREVGYAGMKDRHAVAVQWFSVHLPGRADPDWAAIDTPGIEVLEVTRHARKLHTGALAGNRFGITLRDCVGEPQHVASRIETFRTRGVPNYFGEQRFGRDGENIARARAMFAGQRVSDRHLAGIYLSAARAWLFNSVLAARVLSGSWDRALDGETLVLDGTRSFFTIEVPDDEIATRLAEADIHPSGPLWGRGELPSRGAARVLEQAVADSEPALAAGLAQAGLKQERRALRVIPTDLRAEWLADGIEARAAGQGRPVCGFNAGTLRLEFALPAGCFATSVLRELAYYRDVAGITPEA